EAPRGLVREARRGHPARVPRFPARDRCTPSRPRATTSPGTEGGARALNPYAVLPIDPAGDPADRLPGRSAARDPDRLPEELAVHRLDRALEVLRVDREMVGDHRRPGGDELVCCWTF